MSSVVVRIAAILIAASSSAAFGQFNQSVVAAPPIASQSVPANVPAEPSVSSAVPTVAPEQTSPYSPNSAYAQPQSNEKQIADLQAAVSALQSQLEQLQARMGPGYVITSLSPSYGFVCKSGSPTSANEILSRAYNNAVTQFVQTPFPDGTLVMMWSNCQRQ
jgi:hypothetical protein